MMGMGFPELIAYIWEREWNALTSHFSSVPQGLLAFLISVSLATLSVLLCRLIRKLAYASLIALWGIALISLLIIGAIPK
ncbi:hypothetical protein FFONT_0102 [Fervidicoccus fontis Kam940]|uniref:Uncharacterized protein n=1 Tax=Fervidicoccus fontis (strain DSM 19380 / JCM 18336 / VKM B-2539 / Kam940) TaxID=1163730 RepID=H9ZZD8_FERFK|nr:hypothetical protein FFONT_0102 [Fervidicoccus fontis Kam940]